MSKKILFILKRRQDFNPVAHSPKGISTGLYNSASFMNEMLLSAGFRSALEVAIDNNCIDRLIAKHRPSHVIIEALWVVPSKFTTLIKLHPKVKWIIRLHSEVPFLAGEGMSMDWLGDYIEFPNIFIAANSPKTLEDIKCFLSNKMYLMPEKELDRRIIYLPNFYPKEYRTKIHNFKNKDHIDIACFGAVRPLKNHLLQAIASLKFANKIGKKLKFHINGGRVESRGEPVMNNLCGFFQQLSGTKHEMIIHPWVPREEFLEICHSMDIGLQCSFSETFNIVTADLISQGVPVVGSKEIPWSSCFFNAKPTDSNHIAKMINRAYKFPYFNVSQNRKKLDKYTDQSYEIWLDYFEETYYET